MIQGQQLDVEQQERMRLGKEGEKHHVQKRGVQPNV
jgi:hypothetical protein